MKGGLSLNAHNDTLVVGIGNPLREDDRVGIEVVQRLRERLGPALHSRIVYDPDICLAETFSAYKHVIIVDASIPDESVAVPFRLVEIRASEDFLPGSGVTSHAFSWGAILAMSRDLYGNAPRAEVLVVSSSSFGLSDRVSAECGSNASRALEYLEQHLQLGCK